MRELLCVDRGVRAGREGITPPKWHAMSALQLSLGGPKREGRMGVKRGGGGGRGGRDDIVKHTTDCSPQRTRERKVCVRVGEGRWGKGEGEGA